MAWKIPKSRKFLLLVIGATLFPLGIAWPVAFLRGSGNNPETGNSLKAEATFEVIDNRLTITLKNTSPNDANRPSDVLTGLFFNLGNLTENQLDGLRLESVLLNDNSVVLLNGIPQLNAGNITAPPPPNNNQGGNFRGGWSLPNAPQNIPNNSNSGLGTAGLNVFNGTSVNRPGQGGNFNYGLVSAAYTVAGDNNPMQSAELIQNSLQFAISGLPEGFTETQVNNVAFQYGTDPTTEPLISAIPGQPGQQPLEVPEPNSVIGLITLVAGLILVKGFSSGKFLRIAFSILPYLKCNLSSGLGVRSSELDNH